MALAFENATAI